MNFVEQCRKGAGWPALHRDVPVRTSDQKKWTISQEEIAAFVGQVRSRSDDLVDQLRAKDELIAKMADEKAALHKENSFLKLQLAPVEIQKRLRRTCESIGFEADTTQKLVSAVEKAS